GREVTHALAQRLEGAVSRAIAENLAGTMDAGGDAPADVLAGGAGMGPSHPALELGPVDEVDVRLSPEPAGDPLGQSAERHRLLGQDMEARPDRGRAGECELEGLGDVIAVDVVQDPQPELGESGRLVGRPAPPRV